MERPAFSYRFGTAEFDEARFELRVSGLPVDVERRALEVLAYLLRHAGEVVTKDELLREVWAGRVTVDKVLPNAINKLRRALGEANATHVTTQARLGYRLDGPVTRTVVGHRLASGLELAAGQPVPGRPNFALKKLLGRSTAGEVWLAEQPKTHEQRVYKFAWSADRLRSLKREATLLRLLHESLTDASHIVEILDWNFEDAPYFLECRDGGLSLTEWAAEHLAGMDTAARIELFLQVADAVAAAHSVGVLHKDLKPANVLVAGGTLDAADPPHVRLTDFGSGHMLEPDRLAQLGITRMGMTVEDQAAGSPSTSGTPLYLAPEHFEGHAPTVKSDVYALGILLLQLVTGRLGQPMASGWESEVDDELLRDDIRQATEGRPEQRITSAGELARRLRSLGQRRLDRAAQLHAQALADRDRDALARARARRPFVGALVAALSVGVAASTWLALDARTARDQARVELDRATALSRFLNEDLIGRSNPLVWAKGPDATLREVLQSARDQVPMRFGAQPRTAAAIHGSLATLFGAIELFDDAEAEATRALEAAVRRGGQAHDGGSREAEFGARLVLVRVLTRKGKLDDAQAQLDHLERLAREAALPQARQRIAAVRSTWLVTRGEFKQAAVELRVAIDGLDATADAAAAGKTFERDLLRVDLVNTLALTDRPDEARAEGQRLIDEARARAENSELPIALVRVALVRAQGEDHAAAEQLLLAAQPVIRARLGENHTRHIHLLGELLGLAFRQADWPRASVHAQSLHERVRAKLGADHVSTYMTLLNWARTLEEAGRPAEAVDKARDAHGNLLRLVGAKSPQTQDAAFVLALIELDLGDVARAQPLIEQLDAAVLESGRSHGMWAAGIDALRGIAAQRRGDQATARALLDGALAELKGEEALTQPGRLYIVAKQARARLR